MVFNDPENKQGIIQHIDFLLFGTSDDFHEAYSLVDRVRNCNLAYDEVVTILFEADPYWNWEDSNHEKLPIGEIDVQSGKDNYSMKDSFVIVNQVRIKDKDGNYKTLESVNRKEINNLEATGVPDKYYKIGKSIFPHPIPDYSSKKGLEVQFQRTGDYFEKDDLEKEPGFAGNFHELIPIIASMKWAMANGMKDKINVLDNAKQIKLQRLDRQYKKRGKDKNSGFEVEKRNIKRLGL